MTEHEVFLDVGQRISALRGKLTQVGFAQRLGVSRASVEGWEAGKRLPDGSSLLRMREAFGADINVILTGQSGGVAPTLRPDEEALLANYRQANSDGRERIRQISATAASSPKRAPKPAATGHTITIGAIHGSQVISGDITNHGPQYFGASPPTRTRKPGKS